MIVTLQMKHAVHHQMGTVRMQVLMLSPGFAGDYWNTQCDVARRRIGFGIGKGQYIGSVILATMLSVERAAFFGTHQAHGDI